MLFAALPTNADDAAWELVKEKDGVHISRRPVDGSALYAVRAAAPMRTSMNTLVSLLRDYGARPRWDAYCRESFLYRELGEHEALVYLHADPPWPVTDRDMLMRVHWTEDPDSGTVSMHARATTGEMPVRDDRVRITRGEVSWVLRPLEDGQVAVTTESHIDPNGPLPDWVVNAMSVEGPYDALIRIRKIVASDQPD